uniref:Uncharacterized protein n=1 Tax=Rhipicephalus microplus TaxID=6941 RepID=A0A6G5A336_RHIMP
MTRDEFHCFTPLFLFKLSALKVSYTKLMHICKTCNTIASVQCNKMESWVSWFDDILGLTTFRRAHSERENGRLGDKQVYNVILKLRLNTVIPICRINVCTGFIYTLFWLS